jgi:hypothetical protein
MHSTDLILKEAARVIGFRGLHTGNQFAAGTGRFGNLEAPLDVCAAIYVAVTGKLPDAFFADEVASIRLIEASTPAMDAIRALSGALDSEPCVDTIAPGVEVPNYIEHVSNWAATPPIGEKFPPTTAEVIGRILRASDQAAPTAA